MSDRKEDRKLVWYVCGKCKHENYRVKTDTEENCSECGAVMTGTTSSTTNTTTGKAINGGDEREIREWEHRSRDVHDIPNPVKLDLTNPNG